MLGIGTSLGRRWRFGDPLPEVKVRLVGGDGANGSEEGRVEGECRIMVYDLAGIVLIGKLCRNDKGRARVRVEKVDEADIADRLTHSRARNGATQLTQGG